MKINKLIISILVMITIISLNSQSFAKYVIEYTINVAEISINN